MPFWCVVESLKRSLDEGAWSRISIIILNPLAMITRISPLLAPEKSQVMRTPSRPEKLWNHKFEGQKEGSGEGHEDKGKVPLRKNPGRLGVLSREGAK